MCELRKAAIYGLSCFRAAILNLPPVRNGTCVIGVLRAGCHRGPERQKVSIAAMTQEGQVSSARPCTSRSSQRLPVCWFYLWRQQPSGCSGDEGSRDVAQLDVAVLGDLHQCEPCGLAWV